MKKFISQYWIIIISTIVALIIVFFYIPFAFLPYVNPPCASHYSGEFGLLCNLPPPVTISLFHYIVNPVPLGIVAWQIPFIAFVMFSAFFYGEIKLIISVIKFKNKKYKYMFLLLKILTVAIIASIPLVIIFIISLILSFFGISLTL